MLPDIQHAIRLQILDDSVAALTKEISALPKHIAEIEKKLETHLRRLELDKAALTGNQRDRKRLEGEIQANEQKVSRLKAQMMDAKNNEQYRAFQHEIDFAGQETRKAEDRILELMNHAEPLDKAVQAAEASLAEQKQHVEAEKATARERMAVHQGKINTLKTERTGIVADMTPSLVTNYERIRKGRAGVAVAEAAGGRCTRCNIVLRPQVFQDLKKGETILVCESCGRILYYDPARVVEDVPVARRTSAGSKASAASRGPSPKAMAGPSGGRRVNMSGDSSPASRAETV